MGHSHKQSSATLETVTCGIPARLLAEILYPNKMGILLSTGNRRKSGMLVIYFRADGEIQGLSTP